MPRTRSLAWSELKIGLLTIIALVITAVLVVALTGGKGYFWDRYRLKTRFTNVAGLKPGSPVRVAGVEVGSVAGIEFDGAQVEVVLELSKAMRPRVTTDSTAFLGSVSLLGESAVDITASTSGTPLRDWAYLRQGKGPSQIADVAEQATAGLNEATNILRELRAGRGTAGKLFTDEELYRELTKLVGAADDVAQALKSGKGTMGKLLKDPKAAESLEASLKNLEGITQRINDGEGSLGKLLKDDTFARSLGATTSNMEQLTGKLNKGEGTAGKLLTDATLFNRLNSTSERLDLLIGKLNDGQGTAGQLLKDKQLYENMNMAVAELKGLIADIRKDPKKYLNVKVSLF